MDARTGGNSQLGYVASISTWIIVIYVITNIISYALVYHTIPSLPYTTAHQIDAVIFWVRAWLIGSVFVAHHRPWPGVVAVIGGPLTLILAAPTPILVGFGAGAGAVGCYMGMILYIEYAMQYRILETCCLILLASFYHTISTLQKNSCLTITGGHVLLSVEAILAAAFLGALSSAVSGRFHLMKVFSSPGRN